MANSADPDQTAPLGAVWSGSTLFAQTFLSVYLDSDQRIVYPGSGFHVWISKKSIVQSTLVISNWLISNNRLSRSENLVPVLTQRSTNRQQNIVEKRRNCSLGAISPLFHNIFNISNLGVKYHIHYVKGGCSINCFPQFRKSDMSKYGYLEVFQRVSWSSR